MRAVLSAGLAVAALLAPSTVKAGDFFLKDGDVVVVFGDSITEQRLYSDYLETWVVTRFPTWKLTFRNVGLSGDRTAFATERFKRDVLVHKPTALIVEMGMNDGGYTDYSPDLFKLFTNGLQGIADQAKAAGIRAAWVTPQPLDEDKQGPAALTGYNQTLERFCEGVKAAAEKNGGVFVDQFHPYLAVLDKARKAADKYFRITDGDAVHPGAPGHALMAASILKGLGFPALVSSAEVDAKGRRVVSAINCTVTGLVKQDGGIAFQRLDAALPFFPPEAAGILKWSPILEELNEYGLKVTGLKAGEYEVRLGGVKVAQYSSDALAKGVNLAPTALARGPVAEQALMVKAAVEAKNREYHDQIFGGVLLKKVSVPDWLGLDLTSQTIEDKRQAVYADRLAKLPEMDAAVRGALEMKPHQVEVVPADITRR